MEKKNNNGFENIKKQFFYNKNVFKSFTITNIAILFFEKVILSDLWKYYIILMFTFARNKQ